MCGPRYESNRARPRLEPLYFNPFNVKEVKGRRVILDKLLMRASDDSNNRAAVAESSCAAAFDQRTRCRRSGTSESQLLAFHKRELYSDKVQTSQKSYCRAPLVTERRRTRIPAGALDAGGESTHDNLPLKDLDFPTQRIRGPTNSENQLIDGVRSREYDHEAALLAHWASCLTEFSGDPPQHLNEEVKALTSQFNDLLHNRRLGEGRAACGNSLGKLQQHGATLSSMEPRSHWRRLFLRHHRDTTVSFGSLQYPLCHLTADPRHRERHVLGYSSALAHFESTLQSLTDGKDRKILVESIPQILEEKIRPWICGPWICGPDGNQIISLFTRDHQPYSIRNVMVSDMISRSRSDRQSTYPPVFYGTMASGNQVVKSIVTTDYWRDTEGTVCFKLKAAGLMYRFPYMVIEVIGDDADSHQRPSWQLRSKRLPFVLWWENDSTSRYNLSSHAPGSFLANVIRLSEAKQHEHEHDCYDS